MDKIPKIWTKFQKMDKIPKMDAIPKMDKFLRMDEIPISLFKLMKQKMNETHDKNVNVNIPVSFLY